MKGKVNGGQLCAERGDHFRWDFPGYFSHPFLEGDLVKGPHEPLVSLETFLKVNNIVLKAHTRGYETKLDKEYAPLLGSLRCPVCGHNMTASLSTKMRKKYGRNIGYYVCSHKNCRCNISTKRANAAFEEWMDSISMPEDFTEALKTQLMTAFPILNVNGREVVSQLKTTLAHKKTEIEKIEYNLATSTSPKITEICSKQLEKLESERDEIQSEIMTKEKEILNLDQYVTLGLSLKDNLLKMWRLANLGHKHHLQNLVFPDGMVWCKENDDIEPVSKNEFLFTWGLKSDSYEEKENGQTADFSNLSALAPQLGLEPRTL